MGSHRCGGHNDPQQCRGKNAKQLGLKQLGSTLSIPCTMPALPTLNHPWTTHTTEPPAQEWHPAPVVHQVQQQQAICYITVPLMEAEQNCLNHNWPIVLNQQLHIDPSLGSYTHQQKYSLNSVSSINPQTHTHT